MEAAIGEAMKARASGEYAIGAVIVYNGEVIARAANRAKAEQDATQHAELLAIREASKKLNSRYLTDCIMYTTHEPCPMCAAAAVWAKLRGIVSGATLEDMRDYHLKKGDNGKRRRIIYIPAREVLAKGEPQLEIVEKFMRDECVALLNY